MRHAPRYYSSPRRFTQTCRNLTLNWGEIDSLKWKSASDTLRHQRMAEVLVHSHLPLKEAVRVVVWNEGTKQRVQKIVAKAGVSFPPIEFESPSRRHWFNKFMEGSKASIVMGPREIAMQYQAACKEVAEKIGQNPDAPFGTPRALLDALREDFGCLPHTAELVGLESENGVHRQTVDAHTLQVVERLKDLPEFADLPAKDQDRIELAAFLHDIGKGPKARWEANGGLQKVDPDHPARAMPMMVEILTERVKKVKQENAELILKLVCYHDLVGEVLGKGRDEQQIVDVARTKLELDMLFALGKVDATSLVEWWWNEDEASGLYDRCWAAIKARDGV